MDLQANYPKMNISLPAELIKGLILAKLFIVSPSHVISHDLL